MKKILILGGFGFIGTNLIKYAEEKRLPYRFIVFDRNKEHKLGLEFTNVEKAYSGDFSDSKQIEAIFAENNIDLVVHSISSTVPLQSNVAKNDIEKNLLPTIALLDEMVKSKVRDIIFLSSGGAVYGDLIADRPHREDDDVFPKSSYGVVKLAIEKYMFQYKSLYGIRPMVLRLSNPYGKYHTFKRQGVINVAMNDAKEGLEFEVWGDGNTVKDYIYVNDVCKIIYELYEKEAFG